MFYRTSYPSGPLPFFLSYKFTIMQSRATGIADHILPLGDLLDFQSALSNSRSGRTDFRPERVDFRAERADFRPKRAWRDTQMERWTDRQTDG